MLGLLSSSQAATGTIQDVQHVVILMQENRSFDHYLGSLHAVRGFSDPDVLVFPNGTNDFCQPQFVNYSVLPFEMSAQCLSDVEHGWSDSHQAWDNGRWDQWIPVKGPACMAFYSRTELPFYYALADAYTVCDAYYSSVLGPTYPNRLYLWTGTIDPNTIGGGPATDNSVPAGGYTWTTYAEQLQAAGVSWRVYQSYSDYYNLNPLRWFASFQKAAPGNPLYDQGMALVADVVAAFQSDVTNGTLPSVSWIIPPWSCSEHPPYSPANGEVLTKSLLDALASNPAVFSSTVFIITYDEAGGFFDHVPPPIPPPGTPNEFVYGQPIGLGVRVPTIIVSPWTRGGYVCSQVFDHTSVLRFLETWTGVSATNISSWRRQLCGDLTSAFNFQNPDTSYPPLPVVTPVSCPGSVTATPPSIQTLPTQEPGPNLVLPLPYQPGAVAQGDCASNQIDVILTNGGPASVHFAVYANSYRSDGPWQYDVPGGSSIAAAFNVQTNSGGFYDLSCYGPSGFQWRFAGSLNTNCNLVQANFNLDLNDGGITVNLQNLSSSTVTFNLTNSYQPGGPYTYSVPARSSVTGIFLPITNQAGLYDLTATTGSYPAFRRRFSGQINTTLPLLRATSANGNLILSFPAWATNFFTLESTTDLTSGSWNPVNTSAMATSNRMVLSVPFDSPPSFFRLRR